MRFVISMLLAAAGCWPCLAAAPVIRFDFTQESATRAWRAAHDISSLDRSAEGLTVRISGNDPYLYGPPRDYPEGKTLWLRIRARSESGGSAQLFFFTVGPSEEQSVRFGMRAGVWEDVQVPLPPFGRGTQLRFDPPGSSGTCTIALFEFTERAVPVEPTWPRPEAPSIAPGAPTVRSGLVRMIHSATRMDGFRVEVDGRPIAIGNTRALCGFIADGSAQWIDLRDTKNVRVTQHGAGVDVTGSMADAGGAVWTFARSYRPGARPGSIEFTASVRVSEARDVIYVPLMTLLPGAGSFGAGKSQALLSGVEYLDAPDASSSENDLRGPEAKRRTPAMHKLTLPLMAIAGGGNWIGMLWDQAPGLAAAFDSPDRTFHSGGHLFSVLFPGSDGHNREEGNMLPYAPSRLLPGVPLEVHGYLLGGTGATIVPAVQAAVAITGLPALPQNIPSAQTYFNTAVQGWLSSQIRAGNMWKHAWPGSFGAQPAGDAPAWLDWLALQPETAPDHGKLASLAAEAASAVPAEALATGSISHVGTPAPALVYGSPLDHVEVAGRTARDQMDRFGPDGSIPFQTGPGGVDYGRTHFARDANGLTAQVAASMLRSASFSGDPAVIRDAVTKLHMLDRFYGSVPRGAQTWEVPLHTPDILASAHLVNAYLRGYELTGDAGLLRHALYWAWTGVPFVYLRDPTDAAIGRYSTIAVLGATGWVAPVWIGLPVQWCGMVYADALYRLARVDGGGPWRRIADGITASGIQQTFPVAADRERQGLLPDSFNLLMQQRNDPGINPATVLAGAQRYYGRTPMYDFYAFRQSGILIHAPGEITPVSSAPGEARFTIRGWPAKPFNVLAVGVPWEPHVSINGRQAKKGVDYDYRDTRKALVVHVPGRAAVDVRIGKGEPH